MKAFAKYQMRKTPAIVPVKVTSYGHDYALSTPETTITLSYGIVDEPGSMTLFMSPDEALKIAYELKIRAHQLMPHAYVAPAYTPAQGALKPSCALCSLFWYATVHE